MASPIQWTWVWANSGRLWRTGKPGVLQSMGLQRVGHVWVTEQKQINGTEPLKLIAMTKKKKKQVLHLTLASLQPRSPSDMGLSFYHSVRSVLGIWKLQSWFSISWGMPLTPGYARQCWLPRPPCWLCPGAAWSVCGAQPREHCTGGNVCPASKKIHLPARSQSRNKEWWLLGPAQAPSLW